MFDSVRARLTLWYVAVLALVLLAFSISIYAAVTAILYDSLDTELGETIDKATLSLVHKIDVEKQEERTAATSVLDEHIAPRQTAAIFDASGNLVAEVTEEGTSHASLPSMGLVPATGPELYTLPTTTQRDSVDQHRIAVGRIHTANKSYILVISQPFDVVQRQLRLLRLILILVVVVTLALAGFGGWFLAQRSLAPVVQMTERARRITAENLDQRLPVSNPHDELGQLAATFNELLTRLDDAFEQQHRFMADASHELRTPLSVMRTATGVTLEQKSRSNGEYREALSIIDEQARRLTHIVEDMFMLARADGGRRVLQLSEFYLDKLLCETARAAEVLATRKGITIEVGNFEQVLYRGDESLLRQMVLNLLDNAIKNTSTGGVVSITLERRPTTYAIVVSDTGAGIPPEAQAHIFERFYRVDKARSRADASEVGGGAGLGLSIAKWTADAHLGRLELQRSDTSGSTFVVSLPMDGKQ
ncbi:MAG TPA: ATP-binding protein [Pyrinomonadaceae bacterium]|nr:ATP-binding protein [Pyrinomonadaceae bacterium]